MRLILISVVTTLSKHAPGGVWTIKVNVQARCYPNCLCLNSPPKRRKVSKVRLARAEPKAVVNELLGKKEPELNFLSQLLHEMLAYNVVRSPEWTT